IGAVFEQGLDALNLVGFGGRGRARIGGYGFQGWDAGVEGGHLALELEQVTLGGQKLVRGELTDLELLLLCSELSLNQLDFFFKETFLFLACGSRERGRSRIWRGAAQRGQ